MKHTLITLLQDRPGALDRAVGLFRRRGVGIESLHVAPSEVPGVTRMTAVVDVADVDLVVRQLARLIEVLEVTDAPGDRAVERETALVKVTAPGLALAELVPLVMDAGARLVDVSASEMIIEITAEPADVSALLDRLRDFGTLEVVRGGRVVMPRGAWRSLAGRPNTMRGTTSAPTTSPTPFNWQADGATDDAAA